tara:strand:- start:302 stop:487 length:186 start_codon:yes stop_codon:yes gene_type:complete
MESNQNNTNNSQDIASRNKKITHAESYENLNYLYPNGHRMTNQMRWFKGSRERGIKSDMVA